MEFIMHQCTSNK